MMGEGKFWDAAANTMTIATVLETPVFDPERIDPKTEQPLVVGFETSVFLGGLDPTDEVRAKALDGYAVHDAHDGVGSWARPARCIDYLAPGFVGWVGKGLPTDADMVDAWHVGWTAYAAGVRIVECDVVIPLAGGGTVLTPDVEEKIHAILRGRHSAELAAWGAKR